ncbi:hypothetical protein K435DRAFT_806558 [Dendrothele bispora CBS 962.96]|uniref:Retrovirus-related Pol polyprotein from transposon TNT 1-94-like beta-barrel domain-containing protein n=1 Tax=Dendrothele bispora (strain CBS 962.96) TaxID=1314807 RepID=A0A4S8L7G7_DENBC|nr:hypothetical protein K435DRAFT_806558 [Dendrothele bispora CBS 962.96]
MPSFPPAELGDSDPSSARVSDLWWASDSIACHVLVARLAQDILPFLPTHHDPATGLPRTARSVYHALRRFCNVGSVAHAAELKTKLWTRSCSSSGVVEFCHAWRSGVGSLIQMQFVFMWSEAVIAFISNLPSSSIFDAVRTTGFSLVNSGVALDHQSFNHMVDLALNAVSNQSVMAIHRSMSSSTASRPAASKSCTNTACPNPFGHTIDHCWAPGGGNEGGRDKGRSLKPASRSGGAHAQVASTSEAVSSGLDEVVSDSTSHVVPTVDVSESSSDLYFVSDPSEPSPSAMIGAVLDDWRSDCPDAFAAVISNFNVVLDSGANCHLIRDHSVFFSYDTSRSVSVRTANSSSLRTLACGEVCVRVPTRSPDAHFFTLVLKDCYHAPDLPMDLISELPERIRPAGLA